MTERFSRTGTLTRVEWTNPHIHVFVKLTNEEGQLETWSFEGPPPRAFREDGPAQGEKSDFENAIGKTVTVETSPAWDGSPSGLLRYLTLPDGAVLRLCNDGEGC